MPELRVTGGLGANTDICLEALVGSGILPMISRKVFDFLGTLRFLGFRETLVVFGRPKNFLSGLGHLLVLASFLGSSVVLFLGLPAFGLGMPTFAALSTYLTLSLLLNMTNISFERIQHG